MQNGSLSWKKDYQTKVSLIPRVIGVLFYILMNYTPLSAILLPLNNDLLHVK